MAGPLAAVLLELLAEGGGEILGSIQEPSLASTEAEFERRAIEDRAGGGGFAKDSAEAQLFKGTPLDLPPVQGPPAQTTAQQLLDVGGPAAAAAGGGGVLFKKGTFEPIKMDNKRIQKALEKVTKDINIEKSLQGVLKEFSAASDVPLDLANMKEFPLSTVIKEIGAEPTTETFDILAKRIIEDSVGKAGKVTSRLVDADEVANLSQILARELEKKFAGEAESTLRVLQEVAEGGTGKRAAKEAAEFAVREVPQDVMEALSTPDKKGLVGTAKKIGRLPRAGKLGLAAAGLGGLGLLASDFTPRIGGDDDDDDGGGLKTKEQMDLKTQEIFRGSPSLRKKAEAYRKNSERYKAFRKGKK